MGNMRVLIECIATDIRSIVKALQRIEGNKKESRSLPLEISDEKGEITTVIGTTSHGRAYVATLTPKRDSPKARADYGVCVTGGVKGYVPSRSRAEEAVEMESLRERIRDLNREYGTDWSVQISESQSGTNLIPSLYISRDGGSFLQVSPGFAPAWLFFNGWELSQRNQGLPS